MATSRQRRVPQTVATALAACLLALTCERTARAKEAAALAWRSVAAPLRGGQVGALAYDRASATLAIGDSRGVLAGAPEGPFTRRLRRGPVRDLVFVADAGGSSLLVATARGLFLLEAGQAEREVSPGPGAAARAATRLAVGGGWVAVATDAGVFLSHDARRWQRAASAFPAGPATAVALRERDGELECWAVVGGEPWSARFDAAAPELATTGSQQHTVAFAAADGGPVDILLDPPGADVAVVYPTALALRDGPASAWRVVRPELPPGEQAIRLAAGAGRLLLATPRGLLLAEALTGPWQRAASPAGTAAVSALAGDAGVVFVAADSGVLAGAAPGAPRTGASAAPPDAAPAPEPDVERVHRAALAYLRLGPGRMEALHRGVSRRGWLPIVVVHGGLAHDTTRAKAWDEAVSGGAVWSLVDRDRDRAQDYDVGVSVSWDLGDLAFHPEAIDVSREAREVIELRDDVLDEITQLYFERQRVLAELRAAPDADPGQALRLRLRADELAAGIDAWTGGWFGRNSRPLVSRIESSPRAGGD